MNDRVLTLRSRQSGAVLVTALIFLLAITVLTVSSMRSSKIELHMAHNEESRIAGIQAAQALADAIATNPASTPVTGLPGFTACTPNEAGCTKNDLSVTDPALAYEVASNHISARVQRTGTVFKPPPRIVESSIDKFSAASFSVATTYDRMDAGLGRQQVVQGVLVLVPKQ